MICFQFTTPLAALQAADAPNSKQKSKRQSGGKIAAALPLHDRKLQSQA
ncbi:MAG: hypothetical protein PUF20_09615 [Clostridiales bacterium]|nr:hypothetical protein [Clostridiales bacterium]MDD7248334.1 hypothetical protein [Clostridiales bacterium]MDY2718357.1 hypothetical protein [Oscillospiraceae bacterium]